MLKNKLILKQLIWLIKEEENFYNNYNKDDTSSKVINYINYIENLYNIISKLKYIY